MLAISSGWCQQSLQELKVLQRRQGRRHFLVQSGEQRRDSPPLASTSVAWRRTYRPLLRLSFSDLFPIMFRPQSHPFKGASFDAILSNLKHLAYSNYRTLESQARELQPMRWRDRLTTAQLRLFTFVSDPGEWEESGAAADLRAAVQQVPLLSLALLKNEDGELDFVCCASSNGRVVAFSCEALAKKVAWFKKWEVLPSELRGWLSDDATFVALSGEQQLLDGAAAEEGVTVNNVVDTEAVFALYQFTGVIHPVFKADKGDLEWQMTYATRYHHRPCPKRKFMQLVGEDKYGSKAWPGWRDPQWKPRSVDEPDAHEKFVLFYEAAGPQLFINRLLRHGLINGGMKAVDPSSSLRGLYMSFLQGGRPTNKRPQDPLGLRTDWPSPRHYNGNPALQVYAPAPPSPDSSEHRPRSPAPEGGKGKGRKTPEKRKAALPDRPPASEASPPKRASPERSPAPQPLQPPPSAAPEKKIPPPKTTPPSQKKRSPPAAPPRSAAKPAPASDETPNARPAAGKPKRKVLLVDAQQEENEEEEELIILDEDLQRSVEADLEDAHGSSCESAAAGQGEEMGRLPQETPPKLKEQREEQNRKLQQRLQHMAAGGLAANIKLQQREREEQQQQDPIPGPSGLQQQRQGPLPPPAYPPPHRRTILPRSQDRPPPPPVDRRVELVQETKEETVLQPQQCGAEARMQQQGRLGPPPSPTRYKSFDVRSRLHPELADPVDHSEGDNRPNIAICKRDYCLQFEDKTAKDAGPPPQGLLYAPLECARVEQFPTIDRHNLQQEHLTPQQREYNAFVPDPVMESRCTFCGSFHCSRYVAGSQQINCKKFREQSTFAASRRLCEYRRCYSPHDHQTSTCPYLHHRCTVCGCRGHDTLDKCEVRCEAVMERLRCDFEEVANLGIYTRKRFEKLEWGFYPVPPTRPPWPVVTYRHLTDLPVLDAMATLQSLLLLPENIVLQVGATGALPAAFHVPSAVGPPAPPGASFSGQDAANRGLPGRRG